MQIFEELAAGGCIGAGRELCDTRQESISNGRDPLAPRPVGGFIVAVPADLVATAEETCDIVIRVVMERLKLGADL